MADRLAVANPGVVRTTLSTNLAYLFYSVNISQSYPKLQFRPQAKVVFGKHADGLLKHLPKFLKRIIVQIRPQHRPEHVAEG